MSQRKLNTHAELAFAWASDLMAHTPGIRSAIAATKTTWYAKTSQTAATNTLVVYSYMTPIALRIKRTGEPPVFIITTSAYGGTTAKHIMACTVAANAHLIGGAHVFHLPLEYHSNAVVNDAPNNKDLAGQVRRAVERLEYKAKTSGNEHKEKYAKQADDLANEFIAYLKLVHHDYQLGEQA